jgi:hypothetical protein
MCARSGTGQPRPWGRPCRLAGSSTAGYLRLPRLPSGRRLAARYVTVGSGLLAAIAAARPRGWIVDLRDNVGGNMWPMLAVAAALLDDGSLGFFVVPGGRCLAWSLDRGCVRLDGRRLARAVGPFLRDGMRLCITGCYYAGRDRRPVTGSLPVDHDVGDAGCGMSVAAALSWIRGRG